MDVEKKLYSALKPYLTTPLHIPTTTSPQRATPEPPRTPTTSPSNRSHSTRARSLSSPSSLLPPPSPNSPISRSGVRDLTHRGCDNFRIYLSDRHTQRAATFQSLKDREKQVLIDLLDVDNRRSLLRAKKRAIEGKAKWLLEHEKAAENDRDRLRLKTKRVTSENRVKWIAGELEVLEKERRLLGKEREVWMEGCGEIKEEKEEGEWEWGMMEE
ncbi:hypothetical protein FQN50_000051 [Emmonsiellopsis sp. PD_5]|nr:hypothetical protein FQN50_000051 [Emmonsiellopsis sp. PD_5]